MYPDDPKFKSIFAGDDSEKPSDMADDTILSPDGVNPVSKNDETPPESGISGDEAGLPIPGGGIGITIPGAIPPAYFPGFPNGPV